MGGLFGGGSSSSSGSQTTRTEMDPWLKDQIQQNLDSIQRISDGGFQGYEGEGVAGLNQGVLDAIAGLQGMTGGDNPYQGMIDQAAQQVQGSGPGELNMDQFMNPYTDQVVDSALSDIDRARQMAVNQTQDQALASGAFAGNRSAIADAMTNSEYARQAGTVAGGLRAQGFDTALDAAQRQQQYEGQYGLQQAGLLGQLGQAGNAMQAGNWQNALQGGLIQQENTQAQNAFDYEQYLRENQFPMDMINMRTGAISGIPGGGTSTTTQSGGGNRFGSAAGGALGGAAMGNQIMPGWGTAIGGGLGLLGGMFG